MTKQIVAFELAEDVQDFISQNDDVLYKDDDMSLKSKIQDADSSELLKIVKTIDSPTTIISVDFVDEKFLEDEM